MALSSYLDELLSPYRAAEQGREIKMATDPLYSLLMPDGPPSGTERPASLDGLAEGGTLQQIAQAMAANKYGWTGKQWSALDQLVSAESSWNPAADNPTSTAYGLFQFLDSTRANYGLPLNASPKQQIKAGLKYVKNRYGNPSNAWDFHQQNNWY